jgi:uncharacterized repeat protein (TIGR01451 family)
MRIAVPGALALAAALVLAVLLAPARAGAACVCGFQDGLFTTHSGITVDGNLGDWAPVHGDPDNNICDGPSGGIPDRDAPVQSTGRDITHFAFTWDNTNVFLFTERAGSTSNVQRFIYYADIDNDGLMETGEPVIGVNWQGNNRLVEVYLFQYVSAAPGGDPMVDGLGFGDGYTMPGSFQNVPAQNNPVRSGTWGSASGTQMEFNVNWAELGLPVGAAFSFHVASSNSWFGAANYPSKIDDNLGGCGGGGGSSQYAAVTFVPDVDLAGRRGQIVVAAHTVTNGGNSNDTFDLSSAISGDHTPTITYWADNDASGTLTAGDTVVLDTDGDSVPDTGSLASATAFDLLIAYQIGDVSPTDPNGVATIVTSATSSYNPLVSDSVTDTVTVIIAPELVVLKSMVTLSDPVNGPVNPKAIPGATVIYTIMVTNRGGAPVDTDTVVIVDPVPADTDLFVGDVGGPGSGPVAFVDGSPTSALTYTFTSLGSATDDVDFSSDGGASFGYTPVPDAGGFDPAVTHMRLNPKGQLPAATAGGNPSFSVSFRVRVD